MKLIYDYKDKIIEYKKWAREHYDMDRKILTQGKKEKIEID